MYNERHDLLHELPEHKELIHELKMKNSHFAKLFDAYHQTDDEVHRIETGVETTADDYLEQRKKHRLSLKDQLFAMIQKEITA